MKNDLMDKTRAVIEARRLKAISEYEKRINEVNKKIPQFQELNETIFNTSRDLMNIIASSGSKEEADKKIGILQQYNVARQSMSRRLLTENGFPDNYLDIKYYCEKCHDTGCTKEGYCECFNKVYGQLATEEMNQSVKLNLTDFDTFSLEYYSGDDYDTMKKIFDYAVEYAENFNFKSENIIMVGNTGLGKTHLSLAIAKKVMEKGYSVVYDSVSNILRKVEREHFGREKDTDILDTVISADLLIIDDLGTEFEGSFYNSAIYNIIDSRLNTSRPTIISTNFNLNGTKFKLRYGERITSRISTLYRWLTFKGDDVRLKIWKDKFIK